LRSFEQLSKRGQIQRLRRLAEQVLQEYDLPVKRVSLLTRATNFLYRIETVAGEKYVLRIYSDEASTITENRTEIFWLNAIQSDTDLCVTKPVRRRDGEYISLASLPGIPSERRCVLFRWVPGRPLEEHVTPALYFQFGEMMARLHNHSEKLTLPPDISPKCWDKVFYYPGERSIYREPEFSHLFPPERIALMDEAINRCNRLLDSLYKDPHPAMLIHGDLHFGNIHVERGKLHFLDFEDICLGYPVQDVAISLYYGRSLPNYPDLVDAFQNGYSSLRPWPVESPQQLAGLMAARNANFINYVAGHLPKLQEMLDGMFERLGRSLAQMEDEWQ
jgi:Ser/Thr protein kinase RdoA (MazF antagonist)